MEHCKFCVRHGIETNNCSCFNKVCVPGTQDAASNPCRTCWDDKLLHQVAERQEWLTKRGEDLAKFGYRMIERYWA